MVSFGDNSTKTACSENRGSASLKKFVNDSKYLASVTQNSALESLPNDPRTIKNRKIDKEYNSIGVVKTEIGRGSGWLGNECLVWTAKHIIGEHQNIIGKKVTFYVGQPDHLVQSPELKKNFKYAVEGQVVASGNPKGIEADDATEDWALIKLNTSIGRKVGFIEAAQYSEDDALTCKNLEIAGFPGEKSLSYLWWQDNCPLYSNTSGPGAFNLGCPITKGNSGGPMLCREVDGSLWAIGIAMQGRSGRPYTESYELNFTVDWPNAKREYLKFKDTCK